MEFFLLRGGFPQGYQVVVFALSIFANLVDHGKKPTSYPPYGSVLLWIIGSAVFVVRMLPDFLRFLEADVVRSHS